MAEVTPESRTGGAAEGTPGGGQGSAPDGGTAARPPATGADERPPFSALIIDNLGVWAFIALAITALYGLWATLEILTHWTGPMPGIKP